MTDREKLLDVLDREKLLDVLEFCKKELGHDRDLQYKSLSDNDYNNYYFYSGQTLSYARVIDRIELLLNKGVD